MAFVVCHRSLSLVIACYGYVLCEEICALVHRFEDLVVRLENLECYSKKN